MQKLQPFKASIDADKKIDSKTLFNIRLTPFEHYKEPVITVKVPLKDLIEQGTQEVMMVHDTGKTGKWELVVLNDKAKQPIGAL